MFGAVCCDPGELSLSLCPPLPFVDKAEVTLCYVTAPLPSSSLAPATAGPL